MELLNAKSLVNEAKAQETSEALGQGVAKMPDEATSSKAQVNARAICQLVQGVRCPDRREGTDGVKRGSVAGVSFDGCYTRARGSETKSARAVCWLVAVDSQTGFIHVVPLGREGEFRIIVPELMNFSQLLGYSAITYKSDNEPTRRQIFNMLISQPRTHYQVSQLNIHFCQRMQLTE